jgi:hypothetical protein
MAGTTSTYSEMDPRGTVAIRTKKAKERAAKKAAEKAARRGRSGPHGAPSKAQSTKATTKPGRMGMKPRERVEEPKPADTGSAKATTSPGKMGVKARPVGPPAPAPAKAPEAKAAASTATGGLGAKARERVPEKSTTWGDVGAAIMSTKGALGRALGLRGGKAASPSSPEAAADQASRDNSAGYAKIGPVGNLGMSKAKERARVLGLATGAAAAAEPDKKPTPTPAKTEAKPATPAKPKTAKPKSPAKKPDNSSSSLDAATADRKAAEARAADAKARKADSLAAMGRSGARSTQGYVPPKAAPAKRRSFTQEDATGSKTGERWRSTRYSAMDRNK